MALITSGFKRVVEAAREDFNGLNVDGILLFELVLLITWDKREGVNMLVEVSKRELNGRNSPIVKQRKIFLFVGFKIVQGDAGEVGNDDVAQNSSMRPSRARS